MIDTSLVEQYLAKHGRSGRLHHLLFQPFHKIRTNGGWVVGVFGPSFTTNNSRSIQRLACVIIKVICEWFALLWILFDRNLPKRLFCQHFLNRETLLWA
jgi:hypothetical protein